MEDEKLRKKTVWGFTYRDISIEINNFTIEGLPKHDIPERICWTYYLYVPLSMLPDKLKEKSWLEPEYSELAGIERGHMPYMEAWFADLDWHCEITYYQQSIVNGMRGRDSRVIEIGCDYQHLWDEDHIYRVEDLVHDAKQTVDSLHDRIRTAP